ncbi:MAG: NADPH-dependent 7-cyano-7-deazaguanine reductase QueF [Pseudomonadota bacterium]
MVKEHDKGPLLGQQVAGSHFYDPSLLFPVPRANARQSLRNGCFEAFGEDVWHAYEISWVNSDGVPEARVGHVVIPASSPNLVESKSLKLYLNSLNNHTFASDQEAVSAIIEDLSQVVGADVVLELFDVESDEFRGVRIEGECLDNCHKTLLALRPADADSGAFRPVEGSAKVYTHRMRSLCPVTSQPDWATVVVDSRGTHASSSELLSYLLAFRDHQEFHEQCVERIYSDLWEQLTPEYLSVHALYTRRGGLDICPWRCSEDVPAPRYRLNRQ